MIKDIKIYDPNKINYWILDTTIIDYIYQWEIFKTDKIYLKINKIIQFNEQWIHVIAKLIPNWATINKEIIFLKPYHIEKQGNEFFIKLYSNIQKDIRTQIIYVK